MKTYFDLGPFLYESPTVGCGYLQVFGHNKKFREFDQRLPQATDFQVLCLNSVSAMDSVYLEEPKLYKVRFQINLGMMVISDMGSMFKMVEMQPNYEFTPSQKGVESLNWNPSGVFVCKDRTLKSAATLLLRPQQTVLSFELVSKTDNQK